MGLVANPDNITLLNNKAVALVRLKRIAEAEDVAKKLRQHLSHSEPDPTVLATLGLCAFARRDFEQGRAYYSKSVLRAQDIGSVDIEFRARAHWLYEEVTAGNLDQKSFMKVVAAIDGAAAKGDIRTPSLDTWEALKVRAGLHKFMDAENTAAEIPLLVPTE